MVRLIRKVVVVEDDEEVRLLLQRSLAEQRFEVAAFADGSPALEDADFATADLAMLTPGDTVIREVRARGHEVPIVAITGRLAIGEEARLLALGANAVLWKPILMDELTRARGFYSACRLIFCMRRRSMSKTRR